MATLVVATDDSPRVQVLFGTGLLVTGVVLLVIAARSKGSPLLLTRTGGRLGEGLIGALFVCVGVGMLGAGIHRLAVRSA